MLAAVQKEGNAIHYVQQLTEDARFVLLALLRLTKEPSEKHRTETIPKLITFALALDVEAICQGIAYAARIDYPKLPERSLLAIMTITQLLLAKAVAERSKNPATADMCTALASRLQLAKYALLDQSHSRKGNIPIIGGTLSTPAGQQAIDLALRIEAKIFTMQVAVQSFARGKWLGSFPPGESGTSRCFQDLPIWLRSSSSPSTSSSSSSYLSSPSRRPSRRGSNRNSDTTTAESTAPSTTSPRPSSSSSSPPSSSSPSPSPSPSSRALPSPRLSPRRCCSRGLRAASPGRCARSPPAARAPTCPTASTASTCLRCSPPSPPSPPPPSHPERKRRGRQRRHRGGHRRR